MSTPILNWKEVGILCAQIPSFTRVGKVFVPVRPGFPGGFQKNEWAIELVTKTSVQTLVFSVRSGAPYFYVSDQGLKKSTDPKSASVFGITLGKQIGGATLTEILQPARERYVIFKFTRPGSQSIDLVLNLIPAATEAALMSEGKLIARSKVKGSKEFEIPRGKLEREDLAVKTDSVNRMSEYAKLVTDSLVSETQDQELGGLLKKLGTWITQNKKQLSSLEKTLDKIENEPDFLKLADKLKIELSENPKNKRELSEKMEKHYHLAKRQRKKRQDTGEKLDALKPKLSVALSLKENLDLEKIKSFLGISDSPLASKSPQVKIKSSFLGKKFQTKDGTLILVGRSKQENLDLTFKIARGNDLWMHVKSKPSAHVVIMLNPGKTASLDTLLDAGQILLHFSGGNNWGKTEVDYTYRKYVKRIKNSEQVTYTQNKTLVIQPEPSRLKILFNSGAN
ncbi:MAG: DUF814 domain-containing protein [Xanthomonadaceae bacterium]|nr:DUF814 domain-containing protein [Xanthomonadaceae bacterium]